MPWYTLLLAPFALIFRIITGVRNFLFDQGILKSSQSPIPTLVVGNLSVGGTGKTPMVEFLIKNLRSGYHVGSLSRGYGRKTKGFLLADPTSKPDQIGDEPMQLYRKFQEEIPVYVGEDRVKALNKIKEINPTLDLVILDDAFQHRKLKADFYVLLTPYSKQFSKDYLLPAGRLRESRNGAKRADVIVVTKCPELITEKEKEEISKDLRQFSKSRTPIFFSGLNYGNPYLVNGKGEFSNKVILISGLADDRLFREYCTKHFQVLELFSFPDHHEYTLENLSQVQSASEKHRGENPVVLCTEKDIEKLKFICQSGKLGEFPIFALPIAVNFTTQEEEMLFNLIQQKFSK